MVRSRTVCGFVFLATVVSLLLGCREEVPPLFRRNQAPQTTLVVVPEDSSLGFYRYHVYWRGEDRDGQVMRYLFAITDTISINEDENWDPQLAFDREIGTFTTKTDSVFFFNSRAGRQTFNIVAIDDFGEFDRSPARGFFRVVDRGTPRMDFKLVRTDRPEIATCTTTEPCTLPMYTDFAASFRGTTPNGSITGVTWSLNFDSWQPFGADEDTFFLDVPGDTTVLTTPGDSLWSQDGETVTVHLRSDRDQPIGSGEWFLRVNVRDDASQQIVGEDAKTRKIVVNYDPDTNVYRVPQCDCPNPPPNCDPSQMVPAAWITGIGEVDSFDTQGEWRLFCAGDTLPNLSVVTVYAQGQDDARDRARDPGAGLEPADFRFRFEWSAPGGAGNFNMPFSTPALDARALPVPVENGGGFFQGAKITWKACPFDYDFQASAVDEHRRVDSTPSQLKFFVGGAPVIDSVLVPEVFVFVPDCGLQSPLCPQPQQADFGPDTLLVFPVQHIDDDFFNPQTPRALGWNVYEFPFRAWAHDHPRDRDTQFYQADFVGEVRAWRYSFDCVGVLCQDFVLPGEDIWRANSKANEGPDQQVFDEQLRVTIPMDTICVTANCFDAGSTVGVLPLARFGEYNLTLQGRDTDDLGQQCQVPSDLNEARGSFILDISPNGRTTETVARTTTWLQYDDVRPARKPNVSGKPFVNRKRLLQ